MIGVPPKKDIAVRKVLGAFSFSLLLLANTGHSFAFQGVGQPGRIELDKRIALVIGNSSYSDAPLLNPTNDARAIARTLSKLGFEVILKENATQVEMKKATRLFSAKLRPGGTGLFYYAGHGAQISGENYLIPIGASINTESEVEDESVALGFVLGQLKDAGNPMNILILDACRNNPFARTYRSGARGLAVVNAPAGTLIAYATAPGAIASDGDAKNGLYTQELLKKMSIPNLKIEEVLKQVRISVQQKTQNKQIPWESSSLIRDFYFSLRDKNPGGGQQKETVSGTHSNEVTKGSRADPIAMELKLWESIENSNNAEDFKAYLSKYPNGTFAELARDRSNTLSLPGTTEVGSRPSTQPDTAVEPLPAYYRTYTESKVFQVGFPGNWRKIGNKDDVMFAPEGAYRRIGKKHAITKGVAIGLSHSQRQLPAATDELVSHLRKDSPGLKQQGDYQGVKLAGREGILVVFSNTSEITGDVERIGLHTCLLPNGDLFYVLEVAPHAEYKLLKETLDGILKTIRITERVKSDR